MFSPSMMPLIVPPCATSMKGKLAWLKISPDTTTSDLRNQTMLSPAVTAFGHVQDDDRLVVRVEILLLAAEDARRPALDRNLLAADLGHQREQLRVADQVRFVRPLPEAGAGLIEAALLDEHARWRRCARPSASC